MSARARDLAELVRLPAALTVPGDAWAGAAAAGRLRGRTALLPASSVCLYWAGMALNDWADRDLDALERPERPIPSGRVPARAALAMATGLTAAGIGVAAVAGGRRAAGTATALAGAVWAYDTVLKAGPAGPIAMAATRGLDVLLGASGAGDTRAGATPAALLASHTAAVTLLSRGEVHGTGTVTARLAVAVTSATALLAARRGGAPLPAVLAGTYAAGVGAAQARAAASPDARSVRRATAAGIRGMAALQSALLARTHPLTALGLLATGPVVRAASRAVSTT